MQCGHRRSEVVNRLALLGLCVRGQMRRYDVGLLLTWLLLPVLAGEFAVCTSRGNVGRAGLRLSLNCEKALMKRQRNFEAVGSKQAARLRDENITRWA